MTPEEVESLWGKASCQSHSGAPINSVLLFMYLGKKFCEMENTTHTTCHGDEMNFHSRNIGHVQSHFLKKICNTTCNIIDICFQRYHAFFRYISTCIPIIIQANILMLFMVWTKKGKVYKQEAFFLVPRLLSLKICYPKDICLKALFLLILSTWWKKSISISNPKQAECSGLYSFVNITYYNNLSILT